MVRAQTTVPEEINKIIKIHAATIGIKIDHLLQEALIQYFSQPQFDYCREAIQKGKITPIVK